MIKNIRNFFRSFRKKKKYKNYFLKDNLKDEIKANLVEVGKWSYGRPNIYRWDWKSKIIIGNFCSLGPDINFYVGGDHRADWISTSQLPATQFNETFKKTKSIKIRSDQAISVELDGEIVNFSAKQVIEIKYIKHAIKVVHYE